MILRNYYILDLIKFSKNFIEYLVNLNLEVLSKDLIIFLYKFILKLKFIIDFI